MTQTLYAIFEWEQYTAFFYNGDEYVGQTDPVVYNNFFYEIKEVPDREQDEANLPLLERIAFYGWTDKYQVNPIVNSESEAEKLIINVAEQKAVENKSFYAVFIKENVYSKATDNKYFDYTPVTIEQTNGYTISLKEGYTLKGKITIPAMYNGLPILVMGAFHGALEAHSIFFMEGSRLRKVESAFSNERISGNKLSGVYLPDSVTHIGGYAFRNVETLEHVSEHYAKEGVIGLLPANLTYIGDRAFAMEWSAGKVHIKQLPESLTMLDGERIFYKGGPNITITSSPKKIPRAAIFTLADCRNIAITQFGSRQGDAGVSTPLEFIGQSAFEMYESNGAHTSIDNIYVWDSVKQIDQRAFAGYGKRDSNGNSNVTLYTSHDESIGWDPVAIGVKSIEYNYMGG